MVRLRLYDALSLVPAQYYEASYTQLLRLLVAEFTLAENPANTTTSLLNAHCHPDDAAMLLNCDILDNDSSQLQQQLVPNSNAVGSGALEHDPCSLYALQDRSPQRSMPGPLPLGVAVIDTAITLFGHVFPRVLHKHRLQLLIHFEDSIKQAKTRQAIQINVIISFFITSPPPLAISITFFIAFCRSLLLYWLHCATWRKPKQDSGPAERNCVRVCPTSSRLD